MFLERTRRLARPQSAAEQRCIADINEYGWHAVNVAGENHPEHAEASAAMGPHEVYDATFTYTVGVWHTHRHAELVIVGRWSHVHNYLGVLVSMVGDGETFSPGDTTDELLEGYTVRFDEVSRERRIELLTWSDWANRRKHFEAVQVVLPDRAGRWPEDAGYDGFSQPLLD